jgi:hypothetical protein
MLKNSKGAVVVALVLALATISCKEKPWKVDVASGYKGPVKIDCGETSDDYYAVTVGPSGYAGLVVCPTHRTELLTTRDGKAITADEVTWTVTGDGIPVSIRFTVK